MHYTSKYTLACLIVLISQAGCSSGGSNNNSEPENSRPSARITVDSSSGHAPFTVNFDGTQSTDTDGTIDSYSWDFGDGSTADTSEASHVYTDLDIFTATLTVTDNDGATTTASTTITVHAQVAGYYFGSIESDETFETIDVDIIVGTNLEMYVWDYVNFDYAYWGNYDISAALASGTLNADVWDPGLTFPDGTQFGAIAFSADVLAKQSMIGTYSGVGDVGQIDVAYEPEISDVPWTLAEISGRWTFDDGLGFSETMDVSVTGLIDYEASDGCTASGQLFELDPTLNAYEFEFDLNCPDGVSSNPNGVRAGLAFVDDFFFPETWLVFAGAIGNSGTNLAVSRPRSFTALKPSTRSSAISTGAPPPRHRDLSVR